jgi:4'-phosphopantetheinyl transferase
MPESKLFISFINSEDYKSSTYNAYSLSTDDVIIYTLHLPNYIELTKDLVHFLNPEEQIRSERYYKEKDRNRFIICRAILKIVLAAHSKSDLNNIHLDYQINKKPFLASHPELHFNISHSEDFAVIAISQSKVGIDIEYNAKDFDFNNVLADIFDSNEILDIQNAANKEYAFYTSWTRKEAFVKALGKGIDEDFKNIPCLNGLHSIDSALLKTTENWQVYSFDLAENYLGAIAVQSSLTISKNLVIRTLPKTVKELLEITQLKDN